MADTRIALDYLTDLFAKLAAGDLDPTRVDWPFAAEAWQAARGEVEQVERLRTEAEHHRQDKELLAEELEECSKTHEIVVRKKGIPDANAAAEVQRLRTGIQSIIRQCRESAVLGEDAQAVADELEALIGEGQTDD